MVILIQKNRNDLLHQKHKTPKTRVFGIEKTCTLPSKVSSAAIVKHTEVVILLCLNFLHLENVLRIMLSKSSWR